jgi:outer membrane protein assembly factor BamB
MPREGRTPRWVKNGPGVLRYNPIDGDVLVCTPGGPSATMVGLNKRTGNLIWKTPVPEGNDAAYSSVVIAQAGNVKQYVNFVQGSLVGVRAQDGKLLWSYTKNINPVTNIPTPISQNGYIFSSTGGSKAGGGALLQLIPAGQGVSPREIYHNKALASHIGGFVQVGNFLYGADEQQLMCADAKTGEIKWQDRAVGKGALTAAEGLLYVRGENDGTVVLVEVTPAGYKEKGRLLQPDRSEFPAWPYPVIANGSLYLRDSDGLFRYDLRRK